MDVKSFEDLQVFQRSYKVSLEIHRVTLKLPKVEQYGLAEQMRRASKSVPSNLAEGYGKRRSNAEFNRFIQMAIGSADEMRVWVRYCYDLGYVQEKRWKQWRNEYHEIAKMLNGLRKNLC